MAAGDSEGSDRIECSNHICGVQFYALAFLAPAVTAALVSPRKVVRRRIPAHKRRTDAECNLTVAGYPLRHQQWERMCVDLSKNLLEAPVHLILLQPLVLIWTLFDDV